MTPRPFYRSRLFWLGLPGLVFLLWAWKGSVGWSKGLAWRHNDFAAFTSTVGGQMIIGTDNGTSRDQGFKVWSLRTHHPQEALIIPKIKREAAFAQIYIELPIALLVLLYLAAWSGFVCCWHRRKSRLLRLHTAP